MTVHLRPLLAITGTSVLAPALIALLYAPRATSPAAQVAEEDALLLRTAASLSAGRSVEENAFAVAGHIRGELGACGAVQLEGTLVRVSAAGCRLRDGRSLDGPVTVQVHRGARGFTVTLIGGEPRSAEAAADRPSSPGALAARR